MRLLVVGSSTFLGAPLAESLSDAGHEVSILHPDPRYADPSWRKRFHCHYGQCREGHVLHEALEGIERVIACLASDRDEAELEQTRDLAAAALKHGVGSIVKLSTPAPLRNAPWHPMRVRRHADLLLDGQETTSCIAEVGWIGETLLPMTVGNRMFLPHPLSCPGRMRWQGRRKAVERLAQLVQSSKLPRRASIQGDDYATLAEISSRRVSKHAHLERIFLPGRLFRWLERLSIKPAFPGCRMVYGMGTSDPAPAPGVPPEDAIRDC
jgi:hypothetical protein